MPNINISGVQGGYKTSSMVYQAKRLITAYGDIYTGESIHSNIHLRESEFPGYHYHTNKELRAFIKRVYASPDKGGEMGQWHDLIILFDEIDNEYTHLGHNDKAVREELLGAYQDEKFTNHFFYTLHRPSSVNKIIRDVTEVFMLPKYHPDQDECVLLVIDGRTKAFGELPEPHFSRVFDWYKREEAIV
jgi:hypothetical protein